MGLNRHTLFSGFALVGGALVLAGCAQSAAAMTVCTYSNTAVLAQSKAGQSANTGLKTLAAKVRARLKADRAKLDTHDQKAVQQYGVEKQVLNARLRYTRAVVSKRIDSIVKPLIEKAYNAHHCTLLLDAGAVLKKGETTDLDADVLKALDAQVQTVNFNLLQLPQSRPPRAAPATSTAASPTHSANPKSEAHKPRRHEEKR